MNFDKLKIESIAKKETLEDVKPSVYSNLEGDFTEWLINKEEIPEEFWNKIKDANEEENLKLMLLRIKEELFSLYGNKKDKADSFEDSRFTPLKEMIDRGMVSCGAMAKITGTSLRKFGIPTKFIHGIFESQKNNFIKRKLLKNRHSWLEIYDPKDKKWIPFDMTRNDLSVDPTAEKIKEYHDWDELKESDYKKGNY